MNSTVVSDRFAAGSALFSDPESFMGFVRDISEKDESVLGGGTGYNGKSKSKRKNKSSGVAPL